MEKNNEKHFTSSTLKALLTTSSWAHFWRKYMQSSSLRGFEPLPNISLCPKNRPSIPTFLTFEKHHWFDQHTSLHNDSHWDSNPRPFRKSALLFSFIKGKTSLRAPEEVLAVAKRFYLKSGQAYPSSSCLWILHLLWHGTLLNCKLSSENSGSRLNPTRSQADGSSSSSASSAQFKMSLRAPSWPLLSYLVTHTN